LGGTGRERQVVLFEQNFFKVYKKWCFHKEHGGNVAMIEACFCPMHHVSPDSSVQVGWWERWRIIASPSLPSSDESLQT